jgi:hypothetical protein
LLKQEFNDTCEFEDAHEDGDNGLRLTVSNFVSKPGVSDLVYGNRELAFVSSDQGGRDKIGIDVLHTTLSMDQAEEEVVSYTP